MSAELKHEDIKNKVDPSVARQWDEAPAEKKFEDFYKIADKEKIGILGTFRAGIGPVGRSMAVAKRTGPDFLFLANAHSQKFKDLEKHKEVNVAFQNSLSQDWISVTGTATTADSKDPRIKEVWNKGAAAWFGDLGDGVHDGTANDPRMSLIEVKAKYISYYVTDVTFLGYAKEIIQANMTGGVANTGKIRQMNENEIQQARSKDSSLSS